MQRLVYAPKAYVFIRSSNQSTHNDSRIYDVSDDIVSGSVTRNVDGPSKATLVLRNRFKKYIRDPKTGESIFLPMDMISIWLQRIAGKPIRVFTGYLDSVPYYQGYPGSCTIEATCTLKRLFYQWFDPGLLFFREWLMKVGGWYLDPTTGAVRKNDGPGSVSDVQNSNDPQNVNDGSFGQLIYDFLTQVAGWDNDMVIVSDIDPEIISQAAELYKSIELQSQQDLDTLGNLLGKVLGLSVQHSTSNLGNTSAQEKVTKTIKKVADQNNVPLIVPVVAALLASNYNPQRVVRDYNNNNWGYGLFAMRPNLLHGGNGNVVEQDTIDGYTTKEILSVKNSTNCFFKKLMSANVANGGGYLRGANAGDGEMIQKWVQDALGRKFSDQAVANKLQQASTFVTTWNTDNPNDLSNIPVTSTIFHTDHLTWKSSEVTGFLKNSPLQDKIYQSVYQGHIYDSLAPYYWRSQHDYHGIALGDRSRTRSTGQTAGAGHIGGGLQTDYTALVLSSSSNDTSQLRAYFNDLTGASDFDMISWNGPNPQVWRNGSRVSTFSSSDLGPTNTVLIRASKDAKYPYWAGNRPVLAQNVANNPDPASGNPLDGANGLTMEQLGAISLNAAFQAQFSFPVDFMTSQSLTGERALMNDISCYEAVQQFCQASLRSFMSTPDGKFLAFYPDYFSARRKPYWAIYDIEMTNFGIQLNDEQLATHVYVTGDTFGQDGAITFQDRVSTAGVATIAQAFILDSFIVPPKEERPESWGRLKDAYDFLQHYGARPLSIDAPYIRNTEYEFLMAFQTFMLKWASQFATNVSFTFQPEVFAGGILKFPDHEIQMYCQSVTHTFDYSSGFSTEATLMAPAATTKRTRALYPGMALAGSVNTVGAGIG